MRGSSTKTFPTLLFTRVLYSANIALQIYNNVHESDVEFRKSLLLYAHCNIVVVCDFSSNTLSTGGERMRGRLTYVSIYFEKAISKRDLRI